MRDHFKSTVPLWSILLNKGHCILHMWKLLVPYGCNPKIESVSIRHIIDLKLCDQEGLTSRISTRENRGANIVSHSQNAWKRCRKKKKSTSQEYTGTLDRFLKNPRYRESQEAQEWTEERCAEYDALAQEDHSYTLTTAEYLRHASNWKIQLNNSGPNGPMAKRSDYQESSPTKGTDYTKNQEKPRKSASIQENKVEQILSTSSQRHVKTVLIWTREQDGSIMLHLPHLHPGNTLTNGAQVGQLK